MVAEGSALARRWLAIPMALALGLFATGCLERHDDDTTPAQNPCTPCHGSALRPGTPLEQSAPPFDLDGNVSVSARGVGAHRRHLMASGRHGAVACTECHTVPDAVDSPGHADSKLPAEVVLGELAGLGNHSGIYDAKMLSCSGTYCHGSATPIWNEPLPENDTCGSCHDLPPAPPHVARTDCASCHPNAGPEQTFVDPARHVDGVIDLAPLACNACHGSEASNAPPTDLLGNSTRDAVGVGAHQVHLDGGRASRPLECSECHQVPASIDSAGHLDSTPRAEVALTGVAESQGADPRWSSNDLGCSGSWCHGASTSNPGAGASPAWTSTSGPLGCQSCHQSPPAPPHPQLDACGLCHPNAATDGNISVATIVDRTRHVDGVVDLEVPDECGACHGSGNSAAPPPDLAGNLSPLARGVGAHQLHLVGSGNSRPLACDECHVVPTATLSIGHVDTALPAEVVFSGVATTFGAVPIWDGERCSDSYCHGADWGPNRFSGGQLTAPLWTRVNGSQAACGTCHGLPPLPPHPENTFDCATCHQNIRDDFTFIDPNLHVDGRVDF